MGRYRETISLHPHRPASAIFNTRRGHLLEPKNLHRCLNVTWRMQFMLGFTFCVASSMGFDKGIIDVSAIVVVCRVVCPSPKFPVFLLYIHSSLPTRPLASTAVFPAFVVSPFSECRVAGVVAFSEWLLSRGRMHLSSFMSRSGLVAHLCLVLIVLHGVDVPRFVYISPTHLLKYIFAASKFWQLWVKLL